MVFKWYWKAEELPDNGVVFARIRDDVLDDEDWNVWKLELRKGIVVKMSIHNGGVYSNRRTFVDKTKAELIGWQYTSEDTHPACYQELAVVNQ